ncbi:methylmalonyl-CoA mutase small subunit (plasmid) [Anaerobacillus sp. CMMVII]|uniref:methylmalonyl-CoA mutase subunit beta n=1 Tax=Anaerobacillus sp. CMMVII TaxID=2755588 RepID=UPI0021B6F14E|nr:methylmalonyl-CoA mutase subunit beta [Anaerobacillus sp. CMMVII]MCT8139226.1 methylmalonyl-CoA mutase small subunit [Anaerobacillus sp. CMMVII]
MGPEETNKDFFKEICDFPIPSYEEWKIAVEKSLKGAPFSKLLTRTYEDIILQPMYQQRDVKNLAFSNTVPGDFPFIRGTDQVAGEKSWLVAQEMIHPLPEILNEWLKNDLSKGVNAINLVINDELKLATGKRSFSQTGAGIYTLADLETIFENIDVTEFPILIECGTNHSVLGLIAAYYQKYNLPLKSLRGCIGTDPISMLLKEGTLPNDMAIYLDQMASAIKWRLENDIELKLITIDGNIYHNSGANAVQELAFMAATGVYYIRELQERGLSIDQIASSISFSISIGSNLFMELAKIRSARMLWATIVKAFGGEERSQKLHVHARTSQWTKTVYDPYVNMLRGTVEAFTAALGGVDSLHVSPFDETFTLPSDFSRRTARNIQLIIQEEAHVLKTADPAGGSWYVEHLTDEIGKKSWKLFQQIEEVGGMYTAIQNGLPQKLIKEVSSQKKVDIEKRKLKFVGATMYPNSDELVKKRDDQVLHELLEQRFNTIKQKSAVSVSISSQNMMSDIIDAFEIGASVNDIVRALGSSNVASVEKLETYRATEDFEELRKINDSKKQAGRPANVFLTSMGPLSHHKQRSDFIASFFETGGFQVLRNDGFKTTAEAIQATIQTDSSIAIICGKNKSYHEHAIQIVTEVKKKRPDIRLFVAGMQEAELEKQLIGAGLAGFIHVETNCYQLLKELQGETEGLENEQS